MALARLDDNRVDKALSILAESDLEAADAKVAVLRAQRKAKSTEALVFASLTGGVKEREMVLQLDTRVEQAWEDYFKAVRDNELLTNRRDHEIRIVELYRSVLSARKSGMVV
jgi:hypothetical protein